MRRVVFATAIVLAVTFGGTRPASAISIQFQTTDLPDGVGGDLWQYDYFLTGGNLQTTQGFQIFFDYTLYSEIVDLTPVPAEWDPLLQQPDVVLLSDGVYDQLALVDNPTFLGPFSVSVIWLGAPGTAPGSQPFDIYELDAAGFPDPIESGVTSPVDAAEVPEPSTLVLLATGVAAASLRKRRNQSPR